MFIGAAAAGMVLHARTAVTIGFTIAAALVHELMEARDEKRLLRFQNSWRNTGCSSSTNSASCRYPKPEPNSCSRSSVSATSAAEHPARRQRRSVSDCRQAAGDGLAR